MKWIIAWLGLNSNSFIVDFVENFEVALLPFLWDCCPKFNYLRLIVL